jgi:hypothetical protein
MTYHSDGMNPTPSTAVVHLLRAQNELACFERFMASYRAMGAGLAHDLIVVFKGFRDRDKAPAEALLEGVRHIAVEVDDSGFDVGAYLGVARERAYEKMCFLNSFSRILAPSWLAHLRSALDSQPKAGLVGATGSWEGIAADVLFPNYHVRTTGFLIDRALLVDLDFWDMHEKFDANLFEAGPRSMTRQILARGLEPYVPTRTRKPLPNAAAGSTAAPSGKTRARGRVRSGSPGGCRESSGSRPGTDKSPCRPAGSAAGPAGSRGGEAAGCACATSS